MARPRVSALVLARDEADNLADCLASLAWADETIVVVDAASRDATESIARASADRVLVRRFDDFASQRNAALDLATGDWVFAVDADERASTELAEEVRRAVGNPSTPHVGFRVPIRSEVLGRPFRFSGTQHDRPLRLFRRGAGRWVDEVHETVELKGNSGDLREALHHRTLSDMSTLLRKLDHYTTLEARKLHRQGRAPRAADLTLRPAWTFLKLYLGKGGHRDGLEGFVFCAMSAVSLGVRFWKLRELHLNTTSNDTLSSLPRRRAS